jgi:hypothetical protein
VKRIFAIVLGIAIFATASTMITSVQSNSRASNAKRATDAAFRDGLFLGQLDATQGRTAHISVGRWSSVANRDSFRAGYQAGYAKLEQGREGSI